MDFAVVMEFALRKQRLIYWLNLGVVIKEEWDNMIAEANRLGFESSKAQLQRYYDHYGIGNLATHLN